MMSWDENGLISLGAIIKRHKDLSEIICDNTHTQSHTLHLTVNPGE